MPDYPVSEEALEATAKAIATLKEETYPHQSEVAQAAINAFLAEEKVRVHRAGETVVAEPPPPGTYRLVGPWRPSEEQ